MKSLSFFNYKIDGYFYQGARNQYLMQIKLNQLQTNQYYGLLKNIRMYLIFLLKEAVQPIL